jgi:hypothetical protein
METSHCIGVPFVARALHALGEVQQAQALTDPRDLLASPLGDLLVGGQMVLGDAAYWQLLLAQVAHGAGLAFFYPAIDALVPEVVESEHKKRTNALRKMGNVFLASENARRVEQLQSVVKKMVLTTVTWASRDPEYIGDQFAALWVAIRWLCELQLPETVNDFWTGPPVLERKPTRFPLVASRSL